MGFATQQAVELMARQTLRHRRATFALVLLMLAVYLAAETLPADAPFHRFVAAPQNPSADTLIEIQLPSPLPSATQSGER